MDSISTALHQFNALDRVLIDTSSLIYLSHINLLHITSAALRLMTIAGVVNEFGKSEAFENIEIIVSEKIQEKNKPTDLCLTETAKTLRLPVISEDKKILMAAKRVGLPFFNTLMIMNFLVYKQVIDRRQYKDALHLLQGRAFYDASVFEYGKSVFEKITEKYEKN